MKNKKNSFPLYLSPLERENYDTIQSYLGSLSLPKIKQNSLNQIKIKKGEESEKNQEQTMIKKIMNQIYQNLKGNNQLYLMLNAKEERCIIVEEKTKEFIKELIKKVYENEKNGKEVFLVVNFFKFV